MKFILQNVLWSATLAATLSIMPATAARAHGEPPHAKKTAPVVKEQKPFGIAGDAKAVKRTITFSMTDAMRFEPDRITVREGETIRFVFVNNGRQMHEFVLGTSQSSCMAPIRLALRGGSLTAESLATRTAR